MNLITTGIIQQYQTKEVIVPHRAKVFAEKLNACLDEVGAPESVRERAMVLSKMLDIPKHEAWGLLEGQKIPEQEKLELIAHEFEVDPKWLSGEN